MDVLMVSPELSPYFRGTATGEVVLSLSKALRQLGHDVTVAIPAAPGVIASGLMLARRLTPLSLPNGGEVPVLDGQLSSGVRLVLFDAPVLFDRAGVYGEGDEPYPDNAKRFGLMAQAAAALIRNRSQQGQTFDIVHLHDWPAALVPLALRTAPGADVPSVLTIHDATRQGSFSSRELENLGIPRELNNLDGFKLGSKINVLKGALGFVDALTTVSPSYALEMLTDKRSGALGRVLRESNREVVGVLSGIDYGVYNPATDSLLESRYDAEDPGNKGRSKASVLKNLGLELELSRPLLVAPGELTRDRGFDVILTAASAILKQDVSLVVAGAGSGPIRDGFVALQEQYDGRVALVEEVNETLSHRLFAAADFTLQAARHEPCGATQMCAQRYGALPIAHATGGVIDSVVDCDSQLETGTGFLFDAPTAKALLGAFGRALAAYHSGGLARLRRRVMRLDTSWDRPARRYLQIYRQTIGARG